MYMRLILKDKAILGVTIIFFAYSPILADVRKIDPSPSNLDSASQKTNEGDFVNHHGHLVKNYSKSFKAKSKNKKNAQDINTLVGRSYYIGGIGYAEKFIFNSVAGISISSNDDSGFQGIGTLSYSNYSEFTFRSSLGSLDYYTLEKSAYNLGGILRYYDRAYFLEPTLTVKNFAQVGLGYSHLRYEVSTGFSSSFNPNLNIGADNSQFIEDLSRRNSSSSTLFKDTANVFNSEIGVGSEIGFKRFSVTPSLHYVTSFGDIEADEIFWSATASYFSELGFLSISISEGADSPKTYGLFYGDYF